MKAEQGWRSAECDPQFSSRESLLLAHSPAPTVQALPPSYGAAHRYSAELLPPARGPHGQCSPHPLPSQEGYIFSPEFHLHMRGVELGMPQETLSWRLFPFFNPIWLSSFVAFLHISCGMSICYLSGLLIRVSGRGRSNGLQEPKYVTATLLSLSTKIHNLHEKLEQAALTSPILHMPHEQDPNYFTFL